jgi:hypothetical protein
MRVGMKVGPILCCKTSRRTEIVPQNVFTVWAVGSTSEAPVRGRSGCAVQWFKSRTGRNGVKDPVSDETRTTFLLQNHRENPNRTP